MNRYDLLRNLVINPPGLDYNPAKTARKQVPAVIRELIDNRWVGRYRYGPSMNLDLGGGPYDLGFDVVVDRGGCNAIIDPYARPLAHNIRLLDLLGETREDGVDTATLGNVLNVLPDWDLRRTVVRAAFEALKSDGILVVGIYEGNRSGKGGLTRDGYQANLKTREYWDLIQGVAGDDLRVGRRSRCLIAKKAP